MVNLAARLLAPLWLSLVVSGCGGASGQVQESATTNGDLPTVAGVVVYLAEKDGDHAVIAEALDGQQKHVHRLPATLEGGGDEGLTLFASPSGRFAAVAGVRSGRSVVFALDVESGVFEPLKLPPKLALADSIAWSPNEDVLAISGSDGSKCGSERPDSVSLYLLAQDGEVIRRLDALPSTFLPLKSNPTALVRIVWAPDGRRLLYEVWQGFHCDIRGPYLTNGLAAVDAARADPAIPIIPYGHSPGSSSWSPDSERIVVLASLGAGWGDWTTYTVAAAGDQRPQVLSDRYGLSFVWTERGIYTNDPNRSPERLLLVDPRDGSARPLDSVPDDLSVLTLGAPPGGEFLVALLHSGDVEPTTFLLRAYAPDGHRVLSRTLEGVQGFSPVPAYGWLSPRGFGRYSPIVVARRPG